MYSACIQIHLYIYIYLLIGHNCSVKNPYNDALDMLFVIPRMDSDHHLQKAIPHKHQGPSSSTMWGLQTLCKYVGLYTPVTRSF